ncbi:MAG TPA: hypothetical protein VIX84_07435, partial [Acidimicrobiales bacterium]
MSSMLDEATVQTLEGARPRQDPTAVPSPESRRWNPDGAPIVPSIRWTAPNPGASGSRDPGRSRC